MASLLNTDVVSVLNPDGKARIFLVCEHASNHIPAKYNGLGLADSEIQSHIAWDPGALNIAKQLSELLDAPLVAQTISRLVYDCNRPNDSPDAMRATSENYQIPGNQNLSQADKQARIDSVYMPFRNALAACLESRIENNNMPVVVTIHSFTPVYNGQNRAVEIGILHDNDTRIADSLLAGNTGGLNVQRNQPYGPADGVTHTLVDQALSRGLPNVMIEIRNDLLETPESRQKIAKWLAVLLENAVADLAMVDESNIS